MKTIKDFTTRISLTILTCLTFLSISAYCSPINKLQTTEFKQDKSIIKRTYKLKKFTQSCCVMMIEYSLKEVSGFIKQESDIKHQEITVWFDSEKCQEQDIKDAINKTSYTIIETLQENEVNKKQKKGNTSSD